MTALFDSIKAGSSVYGRFDGPVAWSEMISSHSMGVLGDFTFTISHPVPALLLHHNESGIDITIYSTGKFIMKCPNTSPAIPFHEILELVLPLLVRHSPQASVQNQPMCVRSRGSVEFFGIVHLPHRISYNLLDGMSLPGPKLSWSLSKNCYSLKTPGSTTTIGDKGVNEDTMLRADMYRSGKVVLLHAGSIEELLLWAGFVERALESYADHGDEDIDELADLIDELGLDEE